MSLETYVEVMHIAKNFGEYITLGGGEPTLHRDFKRILNSTISNNVPVHVITNGKNKGSALWLVDRYDEIDDKNILGIELSQDEYHEAIDPYTVRLYKSRELIRTVHPKNIIGIGSAIKNNLSVDNSRCMCETLFVKPSGDIHWCGCANSPKLGNVHDKNINSVIDMYFNTIYILNSDYCIQPVQYELLEQIDDNDIQGQFNDENIDPAFLEMIKSFEREII